MPQVCLNIGAGPTPIEGYESIDHKNGTEAYPLPHKDGSVDEIYASHVLEHFSHTDISSVVNHWACKLTPGGRLRIAVPDFQWIAKNYLDGKPINVQGYTMGGHVDVDDTHHSIFDREVLTELMVNAGLERVGDFQPEHPDCTQLEVSLNLQGYKPVKRLTEIGKTVALLSAPRFGPTIHMRCAVHAFGLLKIPYRVMQGVYWNQVLSSVLEEELKKDTEYILIVDFDSVFDVQDVMELCRLMRAFPDADAICPMQMKRSDEVPLFGIPRTDGQKIGEVYAAVFDRNLTKINTGHFGLTIFKAEALRELSRPWFLAKPNDNGRWDEHNHVDADIAFWFKWRDEGKSVYLSNHVTIGHMMELVIWPDDKFNAIYQDVGDYSVKGIPAGVKR